MNLGANFYSLAVDLAREADPFYFLIFNPATRRCEESERRQTLLHFGECDRSGCCGCCDFGATQNLFSVADIFLITRRRDRSCGQSVFNPLLFKVVPAPINGGEDRIACDVL